MLTSIAGYCQRRPGFSLNVEPVPTVFNNLQRLFTFNDFNGNFYVFASNINASGQSEVYYMILGAASFSLIYTDTASATPFDFISSNNTVYFSNGHVAKKFSANNSSVTNWGIGVSTTNGSAYAGAGADLGGPQAWTTPGNITGAPDAAYATATAVVANNTNVLSATTYGFAIPLTATILGISAQVTGHATQSGIGTAGIPFTVQLQISGGAVGGPKSSFFHNGSGDVTATFGGLTDLWNTGWTANQINSSTFGIELIGGRNFSNGNNAGWSFDAAQITVYYTTVPIVALVAGTLTASTGFQYVYCYGNSNSGHVSSPTPPSAVIKPTGQGDQVTLVASADPQVNQIRVFRTTDSATGLGGQSYFEIPTSPFTNTNQNITDNALDTELNINSIAPIPGFNDPPPPMVGMAYFVGRIYGINGNKVNFSGLEEITIGVPEESFPSGVAGNFWSYNGPVVGLGNAGTNQNEVLLQFLGGNIYAISGNTLDTFRRFQVSNRRGCRNRTTISSLGGMCAWLDTSGQIWATDGSSLEELSTAIRTNLSGIAQAPCSGSFHVSGNFHWYVFCTGTKMLVYDMDGEQWMPPWSVGAKYVYSGETSSGVYDLMIATQDGTKAIKLGTSHNDNGSTYQPIVRTQLFSMVPDFGRRFSYLATGAYDEPSRSGQAWYFQVDTNAVGLADVGFAVDDDPTNAATKYQTLYTPDNKTAPDTAFNRKQGTNVVQNVFAMARPVCRWITFQIKGQNADDALALYGWFIAYKTAQGK